MVGSAASMRQCRKRSPPNSSGKCASRCYTARKVILHQDELELARAYAQAKSFDGLSRDQMKLIMDRGRTIYHWFKNHQVLHFLINFSVLAFLLLADFWVLLRLPRFLLPESASIAGVAAAALLVGSLHSWLMYSVIVFSMHEGAAHNIIFPHSDGVSRVLNRLARNICRIGAGEPTYYSEHHMSHHAKFGTEDDGEFLNFVKPRRFWLTFLPYSQSINYTDFVAHRPLQFTRQRALSAVVAIAYQGTYGYFMPGPLSFVLITLAVVTPNVGFYLDRLRQYTEHNLMPLENKDGSRSFGLGVWGMLIGGGPWGSPCHWEHHLVASLPWYGQLILHRYLVRMLTPKQREQYLLRPVIGFPKLLWNIWRESRRFQMRWQVPSSKSAAYGLASRKSH